MVVATLARTSENWLDVWVGFVNSIDGKPLRRRLSQHAKIKTCSGVLEENHAST